MNIGHRNVLEGSCLMCQELSSRLRFGKTKVGLYRAETLRDPPGSRGASVIVSLYRRLKEIDSVLQDLTPLYNTTLCRSVLDIASKTLLRRTKLPDRSIMGPSRHDSPRTVLH